jgi:cholesterol transport system auxiliary component
MTRNSSLAAVLAATAVLEVNGCAGLHSNQAVAQVYTLEPGFAPAAASATGNAATVQVLRPLAAPGLDSEHIALVRGVQRLDYYAASRWPAPLPELLQSLAIDALRSAGKFRAVQSDGTAFAASEVLQIEIRRCQAEYAGDGLPVVHVQLHATLGQQNERSLVTSVSAESTAPVAENRMQAVVAAFQQAVGAALEQLATQLAP